MSIRKYKVNEQYFENIDSEQKAYFLGLLFADGYNFQQNNSCYLGIALQLQDIDVLIKFKECLDSEHNIIVRNRSIRNPNYSDMAYIQINSKKLSEDLAKLGCIQNKSFTAIFPIDLPVHLYNHFIRGYFDGNGSVWEGKRIKTMVKDLQSKNGERLRTIHNVKFNITGAKSIVSCIQKVLVQQLGFKSSILNVSKNIDSSVQMEYSGRKQMRTFHDFIYQNATVYLQRKKDKFTKIINYEVCNMG